VGFSKIGVAISEQIEAALDGAIGFIHGNLRDCIKLLRIQLCL
jgi:hypothetical protein